MCPSFINVLDSLCSSFKISKCSACVGELHDDAVYNSQIIQLLCQFFSCIKIPLPVVRLRLYCIQMKADNADANNCEA